MPGTPDPNQFADQNSWERQIRAEEGRPTDADLAFEADLQAKRDAAIAAEDRHGFTAPASMAGWMLQLRNESDDERAETWDGGDGPEITDLSNSSVSERLSSHDWSEWGDEYNPSPFNDAA